MILITTENVSKSYGDHKLFENVSFGISDGEKVGLLGVNGAGKSTLVRILMGEEPPDDGRVVMGREVRVEYLTQNPALRPELGALEQLLVDGPAGFDVVRAYEKAAHELERSPEDLALMARVTALSAEMDRVGGWTLEHEARHILTKLGIADHFQTIGSMSGGQQKRVALARALLRPCDLLVLDEPTNHLDVTTVAWLESYLSQRAGGLLLITHDRYFLDRVVGVVLEVADGTLYRHAGNYSAFLESRAHREELQAIREQKRSQLAKRELEWLRRGPKARTTKSKSRIQRAHELLNTSYATDSRKVELDTVETRLGRKIIEMEGVTQRFGERAVIRDFTFFPTRRDRVGIIGPNGAGKSTLLNLVAGRLQPTAGRVDRGDTVVIGYYDQQSLALREDMRVHDYITEIAHRIPTSDGFLTASQMLERFLFDKRKQWSLIAKLSGGERRRLYLLRILMTQPNVLLLDEPTNDLDVETLTVLEDYLEQFEGVVMCVSHDRYFLDRVVEHLLVVGEDGTVVEFPGDYSLWQEAEEERQTREREAERAQEVRPATSTTGTASAKATEAAPARQAKKLGFKEKRELEELRRDIPLMEARLVAIGAEMVAKATDYMAVQKLHEEKCAFDARLEASLERWMELEEMA